jgi:uncharacterized protein (DUF3084 family)
MDFTSLVFVALMILMTGVMAWLGDMLGRYLGKKRIKLGPLRPKHTAALLTALAGSGGALVLVLILMASAEPVRVWIISGNQVRAELAEARQELASAQTRLRESSEQAKKVNDKLNEQGERLKQAREDGSKLTLENLRLARTSDGLRKEISVQQVKAAKTLAEAQKARAGLVAAQAEVKDLETAASTIKGNNVKYAAENYRLTMANTNLEEQAEELTVVRRRLESETKELKESIQRLQDNFDSTSRVQREQLQEAQKLLDEAETELKKTGLTLETIQSDVARMQRERVGLMSLGEAARTRPMVASLGDELARFPVAPNLTLVEAENLMRGVVEKASQAAKTKGAGLSADSSYAGFIDLKPQGQLVTAKAQEEGMVRLMSGGSQPKVLVIKALYNAFQGEFIPVSAELYQNPIVYKEGQVIADVRLNGAGTQEEIAAELAKFVEDTVSPVLRRSGLIPVVGSPQPYGEIPRETVLRIVQEVKASGVSVRIYFVAAADIRAGDPFKLAWRLK